MAPSRGQRVWLPVDDEDFSTLATVTDVPGDCVFVERLHAPKRIQSLSVELTLAQFSKLSPVVGDPMNPGEDLVVLEDVSEATILHTLRLRLQQGQIFTAIGPVLVVVNPYQPVECCSDKVVQRLSSLYAADPQAEPPHAHKIVVSAYSSLVANTRGGGAQAVLVSGESGAGKTETTKLCLSCLAQISGSSGERTDAALESSFLLEAFGNARTVYNHNSSRFGKWCAVHFDAKNKIDACKIESYLLEQSRIVGPAKGERNYHAFYYLLAAPAEERKKLALLPGVADYHYTSGGEAKAPGIDDAQGWRDMRSKLATVGFDGATSDWVFSMIATVLLLGNVRFKPDPKAPASEELYCVDNPEVVAQACSALGLSQPRMLEQRLTQKVLKTGRGSSYTVNLSDVGAADARDAFAKALYAVLFDWFIGKLNEELGGTGVPATSLRFIGFLDIFGFENFAENGFEQLCINFTNEKLQQHFTDALILRQQEEYKREGVSCAHIKFPDNAAQIELLDAQTVGVFAMLDEECVVPKGSDAGYVAKMHAAFAGHALYSAPRLGKNGSIIQGKKASDNPEGTKLSFLITHYAGEVLYTAADWLEKNRGALRDDMVALFASSADTRLAPLFREYRAKSPSVGFVYRASLRALSGTMGACSQHFIRCLKPNMQKEAGLFDGQVMTRQLAYTGCTAVVEIQRSGYPVSFSLAEFIRQYRCIAFDRPRLLDDAQPRAAAVAGIIAYAQELAGAEGDVLKALRAQVGKTKVFMKDDVLRLLEEPRRAVVGRAAVCVQRYGRGFLAQKAMGNVAFHRRAVVEIRALLGKRDAAAAEEKLQALCAKWEGTSLDSPMVVPLKRQLAALAEDVDDLKHYRKFAWDSGDRYEGAWRNDDMNGRGTYYYADGNIYEGKWKDGLRHGEGVLTWKDGQQYAGQWEDDVMSGVGKYSFLNGSTYEGAYEDGARHGKGKFSYADGGVYEGNFERGVKCGHGSYTDATGRLVYEGQWKDKEHGEGRFIFPGGEVYEGQFVMGTKEGKAVYTEPCGNRYEGEFVNGKREGKGRYTYPDGTVAHDGMWQAGQPAH